MPARSRTLSNWSISVITRLPSRIMNSQSSSPRRKGAFADETPPRCVCRTPVIWRGIGSQRVIVANHHVLLRRNVLLDRGKKVCLIRSDQARPNKGQHPVPFGYLQRDRSPVAAQPQHVAFRSQRDQRLPLYWPVREVQRFVHIKSVHLHTNFSHFSQRPNGKFHACRRPHTKPSPRHLEFALQMAKYIDDPELRSE